VKKPIDFANQKPDCSWIQRDLNLCSISHRYPSNTST